MAPCGCFFDPRIYRIEWVTANFVQPSVYKLSGGPGPQNTYLLDSEKYLKGPLAPVPYPAYQTVTSSPQFVLPCFKTEGPAASIGEQPGFLGNPLRGSPFADAPQLHGEGLAPAKDHKAFAMVPGLDPKERPGEAGSYEPLQRLLNQSQDFVFQTFKGFQAKEGPFKDATPGQEDLGADTSVPSLPPEDSAPLGASGNAVTEPEPPVNLESIQTDKDALVEEEESFYLPEKVLLEDAMKLFDCSPVNSDTEASLDELSHETCSRGHGEEPKDGGFPGEDSPGDIRSLNLPDELLSFDYSVPEILSTVTSLDYLYDVNAFADDWESHAAPQLPANPESRSEPEEEAADGVAASKRGKGMGSKAKLASSQGGDSEPQEPEAAMLGV